MNGTRELPGTTRRRMIGLALDGKHPRYGRKVEIALIGLIVLSAILMGVETLPNLPGEIALMLETFEIGVTLVFALEYVLRLWTSDRPFRYATSFYGIIDLVSILPTLLGLLTFGSTLDMRALRAFRLLRLLRLLKMGRYTNAADRLKEIWNLVREEILIFGITAVIVLYVCALIVYQFENEAQPEVFTSVFTSMWWAAVTLTTVGYGDMAPITFMGRLFTVLMLFVALGIIAVPTGLVASAMSELRKRARKDDPGGRNGPDDRRG